MSTWMDPGVLDQLRAEHGADHRSLYEQWPAEPLRCDNQTARVQCPNEATLDIVDPDGHPTGAVACGPCSHAHPNLKYRRRKP